MSSKAEIEANGQDRQKAIKCVVWDLDNTLWDGVLLEHDQVNPREQVIQAIKTFDSRGILQSVASKNDSIRAEERLSELGLMEYFLFPQINWNPKSSSITTIARLINIGLDAVAFIDDQSFEREEVAYSLPDVLCFDITDLDRLLGRPEMNPRFITDDARMRRLMYISDMKRKAIEEQFVGPKEDFLATLNMVFTISLAKEEDLKRAEELTTRTNQLNTTGYTYSYDELRGFLNSPRHKMLITSLEDKFGAYGKIGLAFLECAEEVWTIKLLLMSCRVMSRGVGTVLLSHIMQLAKRENVRLRAEFVRNGRNRMMLITYKFAGFKEVEVEGNFTVFENSLAHIQPFPDHLQVRIED